MITFEAGTVASAEDINANFAELEASSGEVYQVDDIYITTSTTAPATRLGYGTWEAFGAGKVPIGIDEGGDADFDTVEETGGAKTVSGASHRHTGGAHTHSHNHDVGVALESGGIFFNSTDPWGTGGTFTPNKYANSGTPSGTSARTRTSTNASGASANNTGYATHGATSVVQPYVVVYMWKRTA